VLEVERIDLVFVPMNRCRWIAVSLLLSLAGCGKQTGEVSPVQSNLGWLGSQYGMFVSSHRGRPPKNDEEFRKYIEKTATPQELDRLKAKSVDELFTSPRDGKPFKMVTYAKLPGLTKGQPPPAPPVVLYEEAGQGGKFAVAYLGGNTQTVDQATLRSLLPTGGR
jgi:hypothetical protein